ncbi:MAG: hypothetical protein IKU58_03375 [Clostridia bacterium]|nr:hypothetical protein [Clostridia bacterium]
MTHILRAHFARYPQMTPQDAVKLLYQSAFGPGHLIRDEGYARARLAEELAQTPPCDGELLEDIGGGYARLHLGAAKAQGLSEAAVYARFSRAAAAPCPGKAAFEGAIACLEALAAQGEAPFSAAQLAEYLTAYRAEGCPMVSHSETYRAAYRPAYRVVLL